MSNLLVRRLLITSLGCRNCVKRLSDRLRSHKSYNETQAAFLQIPEFLTAHVSSSPRGPCGSTIVCILLTHCMESC